MHLTRSRITNGTADRQAVVRLNKNSARNDNCEAAEAGQGNGQRKEKEKSRILINHGVVQMSSSL